MLNASKGYDYIKIFVLRLNLQQDTENSKRNNFYKLPNRDTGIGKLEE